MNKQLVLADLFLARIVTSGTRATEFLEDFTKIFLRTQRTGTQTPLTKDTGKHAPNLSS